MDAKILNQVTQSMLKYALHYYIKSNVDIPRGGGIALGGDFYPLIVIVQTQQGESYVCLRPITYNSGVFVSGWQNSVVNISNDLSYNIESGVVVVLG